MRNSALLFLLGAGLGLGMLATGCGDDDDRVPARRLGGQGESCASSADCKDNLSCLAGFCLASPVVPDGGGGTGPTGPALSGEGESCTRTADCETSLVCIQQTCVREGAGGSDAGTAPGPRLGQRGESCQIVSDCAAGLTCVLRSNASGGVCDVADYGLIPTGKSCVGECGAPEDCCELPPTGVSFVHPTTGATSVARSCADIVAALGGALTVCNPAPAATSLLNPLCFFHATYCTCAANLWACDMNRCMYSAPCQAANGVNMLSGCPSATRSGRSHASCDATSSRCQTPAASQCTTDASCLGLLVAELDDTCSTNECACVQGSCYRKCNEDLDCPTRYKCDTMTEEVCVQENSCTTNAECVATQNEVKAECREGKCVTPCSTDHECSGSGLTTGGGAFQDSICSDKGICEPLGCSSNSECASGNARMFCVTPTAATAPIYRSALTD